MRAGVAIPGHQPDPLPENAKPWQELAHELRTEREWSYQRIADALDKPYRRVYKALNRDKVRQWDSASDKRHRTERTQRTLATRRQRAPRCVCCKGKLSKPTQGQQEPVCYSCRVATGGERAKVLAQLYRMGWSFKEISRVVELSPESIGARLSQLRKDGWDLPYRRSPPTRS